MAAIAFPKEMENYPDEWVALTRDNKLGGHGKTPGEALASARANGHEKMEVSLFYNAKEFYMPDMVLIGGRFIQVKEMGNA